MSHDDDKRDCPRCTAKLLGQLRSGEGGGMMVWKCGCGWAGARTISHHEQLRRKRRSSGVTARVSIGDTVDLKWHDDERASAWEKLG